jgi:hypothetical protein
MDSDRDDFAGIDAVEQCARVISELARVDRTHQQRPAQPVKGAIRPSLCTQ